MFLQNVAIYLRVYNIVNMTTGAVTFNGTAFIQSFIKIRQLMRNLVGYDTHT
jgi:uncharacterized protein YprB with RNaseH-like and TPR domain